MVLSGSCSDLLALLTFQHLAHLLEAQDGALNASEEQALPGYGSCHQGLVVQWRLLFVCIKVPTNHVHLPNPKPRQKCHVF